MPPVQDDEHLYTRQELDTILANKLLEAKLSNLEAALQLEFTTLNAAMLEIKTLVNSITSDNRSDLSAVKSQLIDHCKATYATKGELAATKTRVNTIMSVGMGVLFTLQVLKYLGIL